MTHAARLIAALLLTTVALRASAQEPTIFLTTADEDVRIVLDAIAEQSGYNIVLPTGVDLKVRVRLNGVTVTEALDSIVLLNGFQYQIRGRTILVYRPQDAENLGLGPVAAPPAPVTARVYELNHLPVETVRETVEKLLSPRGQMMSVGTPPDHELATDISFLTSGVAAAEVTVSPDQRTYRFVVVDEEAVLDRVERVVRELDKAPRQVYVSTVIFEMQVSQQEQIGFRWRISASLTPSSLPWNFPFGSDDVGEYSVFVDPDDANYPGAGNLFPTANADDFLFGRVDMSGSQLLMELNRLGGNINLVSNPRLMVVDHQEAVILVGERYPILSSTITDQGTVTESLDRYESIGVQLRVRPHILDNGAVDMVIEPQVSALGQEVVGTTGLTTPRITTRRVASKIRVSQGESIVIAGLVNDLEQKNVTEVPILSKIPIIGRLFRHTSTTHEKIDLVVVVTPYLDESVLNETLDDELEASGVKEPSDEPEEDLRVSTEDRK